MEVQAATSEDCRALVEVHVESWQHAYRGMPESRKSFELGGTTLEELRYVPMRANPSFHPTCYSGHPPLPHAGEPKRG